MGAGRAGFSTSGLATNTATECGCGQMVDAAKLANGDGMVDAGRGASRIQALDVALDLFGS
jgi:hypothetical protein